MSGAAAERRDTREVVRPDALPVLEEERDFLLRSLEDLERERSIGDIDDHDYAALKDDYTARAAELLRAICDVPPGLDVELQPTHSRRRLITASIVVVGILVLGGVVLGQALDRRESRGPLTGEDVASVRTRIAQCESREGDGDTAGALDCYDEVVSANPFNATALTYRGWLQVRAFDVSDGIADLDEAIGLDQRATAPYIFRASGRIRSGDAPGAIADLSRFYANGPDDQERALADRFTDSVVEAALDACIGGDASGSMRPVDVAGCYRNVLSVDPENPSANVYLGWLVARSGLVSEALPLVERGLSEGPTISAGYVFRAAIRASLGDQASALADLDRFDGMGAPEDQAAAAAQVRAAIAAGRDPLER